MANNNISKENTKKIIKFLDELKKSKETNTQKDDKKEVTKKWKQ